MAKKIAKLSPKPAAKPAPKPAAKPAPLDLVRNPNFDSAMAQKNYANLMAFEQARLAAQQGQQNAEDIYNRLNEYTGQTRPAAQQGRYTQGRLMGAPVNQGPIPGGNMQFPNLSKEEIDNLNNPNGYWKGKDQGFLQFASPSDIQLRYNDIPQAQRDELAALYQPSPMQGAMASQYQNPQGQQMQNYQNFLQQGMRNSNTLNQGGMANFAKMQAGMQAPQQTNTTTKPKIPLGGIGMQQPKQASAPRKFSTVSNSPARFG